MPHIIAEPGELNASSFTLRKDDYTINGNKLQLGNYVNDLEKLPFEQILSRGGILVRYSCWLTSMGCTCKYKYGGKFRPCNQYPPWLVKLTKEVAEFMAVDSYFLGSCVINKYAVGAHDCYWHADDEILFRASENDRDTFIVSLPLGATREFGVRKKYAKVHEPFISLNEGDLYVMNGRFQDAYEHSIQKSPNGSTAASFSSASSSSADTNIRYNFTWRWHRFHNAGCIFATKR